MKNALIIGSNGVIGQALSQNLLGAYEVHSISRDNCDFSTAALADHARRLATEGVFDLIICCIGVLHNDELKPEKRLSQIDPERLLEYYRINAVIPALCLQAFTPLLKRSPGDQVGNSVFVMLSAMVGSIGDNGLGGWYGYRSSKAALNMLVKTAAIEVARQNKRAALVCMHPGTTKGPLSKPFSSGVSEDKYYTPEQSAQRIIEVAQSLSPQNNGEFYNWDGSIIPW